MQLKSLEIFGFKSFADRITIDLSGGVTCFVGPNGCGKSNVVDSIKWVLGEQRVTALRGDRMQDVIFKGNASGRRQAMNFAEVSLTVSNECGTLPIEFDEVVVTRRLFRSGESEYLLNRSPVRLKDIKKLFMNTGIGLDAYSIMEQGKIDRILETNPKDRRIIFEEAAGISLFKAQRREAERKLERTRANLLRLGDIIEELEKRIRSLKNQAGRARTYIRLSERIKELRKKYYGTLYRELAARMEKLAEEAGRAADEENRIRKELADRQKARDELAANLEVVKEGLFSKRSRLAELKTALEECDGKIALMERRRGEIVAELGENSRRDGDTHNIISGREDDHAGIVEELEGMRGEEKAFADEERRTRVLLNAAAAKLEECRSEIEEFENSIVDYSRKEVEVGNKLVEARARLKGQHATRRRLVGKQHEIAGELYRCRVESAALGRELEGSRDRLESLEAQRDAGRGRARDAERTLDGLRDEIRKKEAVIVKGESRIELLRTLVESREGVVAGARIVMEEAARPGSPLSFVLGILGEKLDVDVRNSKAIEAVLGELAEAVVVRDRSEAGKVRAFLRERELGGVTVLTLSDFDGISAVAARPARSLAEHVRCAAGLDPIVAGLLSTVVFVTEGDVLPAEPDASAVDALPEARVDRQGDFYRRGILRIGGKSQEPGVISRRSELNALSREMEKERETLDCLLIRRRAMDDDLARLRASNEELTRMVDEVEFAISGQSAEEGKVADRMKHFFQEYRVLLDEGFDIDKGIGSLNSEMNDLESMRGEIRDGVRRSSKELDVAGTRAEGHRSESVRLERRLKELEIRLVERRGKRESLEKEKTLLDKNLGEFRDRLAELERDRSRLRANADEVEGEIARLKDRTGEMASEKTELSFDVEGAGRHLDQLTLEFEMENRDVQRSEELLDKNRESFEAVRIEMREVEVRQQNLRERAQEEISVDLEAAVQQQAVQQQAVQQEPADVPESDGEGAGESTGDSTFDLESAEAEIREIRQKIARIGNVNLEAVSDLERVEERYCHLTEQRDDLLKAQKSLQEMIFELNRESRRRFAETFEDVRSHFNGIFRKLFHGGRADIAIAENEDILEAGIEIIAGPPRKDVRSISLLSGGERTLTAVALLFALFKARPSPFCLLDEVDAALDETNIERFCTLLQEFLKDSQFMIVTHSKRTMSHADIIYGVTMETGGVSKVISIKLKEVKEQVA